MNNEQIYKYAWKSGSYGDKLQKKQLKPILLSALLAIISILMIGIPLTHVNLLQGYIGAAILVLMVIAYLFAFVKVGIRSKKILINYEYNLVRADERNRIAIHNKILHEDSRG